MCVDALKDIYRVVVLAKLLYASPACWGFATTSDKQRIEAFVRPGVRLGLYSSSDPTRPRLLRTLTKDCPEASSTASYNSFFQNTTVTATVFARNFVTRQSLTFTEHLLIVTV